MIQRFLTFIIVFVLALGGCSEPSTNPPDPNPDPIPGPGPDPDPDPDPNPDPNPKPTPTGFTVKTIAGGLVIPWEIRFSPDGVLYFTERGGQLGRVNGSSIERLTHSLPVHAQGEGGLLGLVFDPQFASNRFLYVCYTYSGSRVQNRVSRLSVSGNRLLNEQVIIDAIPGGRIHNGCRLAIGPDGKLYASTGDTQGMPPKPLFPQDPSSLAGKILRVNLDGSIPSDNPFGNAVWSIGHRNPQGLAFATDGKLYSTEHGNIGKDEVNLIEKGRNYGWPDVEGYCDSPEKRSFCDANNVKEPLALYTPALAPTGIVAYQGDTFPQWQGKLFFSSLSGTQLRMLTLAADGSIAKDEVIINGTYGRIRDVSVGPDGKIYIATSNRDGRGSPAVNDDRILVLEPRY